MKRLASTVLVSLVALACAGQGADAKSLLWKITGPGIEKPSFLFGTIHAICRDDATLSANLEKVIRECDEVYFEVDMDNLFEMLMAARKMKMRGDTTLRDLLSEEDYLKVKDYFSGRQTPLPFSMLETYKPILAAAMLEQSAMTCESTAMEQVILLEAKSFEKEVKGLESLSYQASVLDSIPYQLQASQLVEQIDKMNRGESNESEMEKLFAAYKAQDLAALEQLLIHSESGIGAFADVMLFNRNRNWVNKLRELLPKKSLLIAVGAGHLPGEQGLIELLRKEGYQLTPVENRAKPVREI